MKALEYFKSMTKHIPGEVTLIAELGVRNKGRPSFKTLLLNIFVPFIRFRDKPTWRFLALVNNDSLHYLEYAYGDEEVIASYSMPLAEMTDIEVEVKQNGFIHKLGFMFREKKQNFDVWAYPSIFLISEIPNMSKEEQDEFKHMTEELIRKIQTKGM